MNGPVKQRAGGSPGVAVVAKVEGRQKQTGQMKRQESATRLEAEGVKVGHTRKTPPDRTLTRDANPPTAKERFIARPNIPNRSDATARMMAELKALTQAQQQAYPRSQQKAAPATAPLYSADKPAAPARTRAAARIAPPAKTNPTGKAAQQSVDFVPMFEYFKGWEQLPNILESQLPTPPKKDTAGKETTSPDRAQSRAQVLELLKKSDGQSLKLVEDKGKKFISYEPGVRSGGGSMAEQFDQLDQLKLARLLYKISGVETPGYTDPSRLLSHLREQLEKGAEDGKRRITPKAVQPPRVADKAVRPLRLQKTSTAGKTGQARVIDASRAALRGRQKEAGQTKSQEDIAPSAVGRNTAASGKAVAQLKRSKQLRKELEAMKAPRPVTSGQADRLKKIKASMYLRQLSSYLKPVPVTDVSFDEQGQVCELTILKAGSQDKTKKVAVYWDKGVPHFGKLKVQRLKNLPDANKSLNTALSLAKDYFKPVEEAARVAKVPGKERLARAALAIELATELLAKAGKAPDWNTFLRNDLQGARYELADKAAFVEAFKSGDRDAILKQVGKDTKRYIEFVPALLMEAIDQVGQMMDGHASFDDLLSLIKLCSALPADPNQASADALEKVRDMLDKMLGKDAAVVGKLLMMIKQFNEAAFAVSGHSKMKELPGNYWRLTPYFFGFRRGVYMEEGMALLGERGYVTQMESKLRALSGLIAYPELFLEG